MESVEAIAADAPPRAATTLRHDWSAPEAEALLALPFAELMFRGADGPSPSFRPEPGADVDAAEHKDRRLPRKTAPIVRRAPATTPGSQPRR